VTEGSDISSEPTANSNARWFVRVKVSRRLPRSGRLDPHAGWRATIVGYARQALDFRCVRDRHRKAATRRGESAQAASRARPEGARKGRPNSRELMIGWMVDGASQDAERVG
jgi:hypothetical protein